MGAVTTQRAPFGTAAMVIALVTLLAERRAIIFPAPVQWHVTLVIWSAIGLAWTNFPDDASLAVQEFAKTALVGFALVNVITSRARHRFFLLLVSFFFFLYPLRGTLQYYFLIDETLGGRAMWNHMYSNPNDLAGFCLLQLSVVLSMMEVEKGWARWFARLCALLLPLIIVLTQSRGAMIALTVFMLLAFRKYWRDVKKLVLAGMLAVGIVMIAPDSVWNRVGTIADKTDAGDAGTEEGGMTEAEASSAGRLGIWKVAAATIGAHPFGVGIGTYSEEHVRLASRMGVISMAQGKRDTHSTYLKLLAERGYIGLFCFLAIVVTVGNAAFRARKTYGRKFPELAAQLFWLEVGMYGYLVAGIWGSYDQLIPTYVHLMLVYATAKLLTHEGGPVGSVQRGMRAVQSNA